MGMSHYWDSCNHGVGPAAYPRDGIGSFVRDIHVTVCWVPAQPGWIRAYHYGRDYSVRRTAYHGHGVGSNVTHVYVAISRVVDIEDGGWPNGNCGHVVRRTCM